MYNPKNIKIMMKAYYIEVKTYVNTSDGYEIQVADLGKMPFIKLEEKAGLKYYEHQCSVLEKLCNNKLEKEYTEDEFGIGNCLKRREYRNHETKSRTVVSLYEISIG